jgi:hypothetical protein
MWTVERYYETADDAQLSMGCDKRNREWHVELHDEALCFKLSFHTKAEFAKFINEFRTLADGILKHDDEPAPSSPKEGER